MRKTFLAVFFIAPTCAGLLFLGLEVVNAGKIARGIIVANINLSGMAQEDARTALSSRAAAFLDAPFVVSVNGTSFATTPNALGMHIDSEDTAQRAYEIGRNANFFKGTWQQLHALVSNTTISLTISLDEEQFASETKRLFAGTEVNAQNATFNWDTNELSVIPEQEGKIADRKTLEDLLIKNAHTLLSEQINITLLTDVPTLTLQETDAAYTQAMQWLAQTPLILKTNEKDFTLDKNALALILELQENEEGVSTTIAGVRFSEWLASYVKPHIEREAKDAQFEASGERVTLFVPSQAGLRIDEEISRRAIEHALLHNEPSAMLSLEVSEPAIATRDANDLGIIGLIGRGETDFSGSPKNRIHNIRIGAKRFDGVLIAPGEEFSFNTYLGPVSEEAGYKPELVILQDRTVPQLGGGLCQVSTTAFRAAVFTGLEVTQRRNHAYVVRYYGEPGFDATIYPPNPDLKFKNDTKGYILIQTRIEGTKLIFEFYGTPDDRKVTVDGPHVYSRSAGGAAKATLKTQTLFSDGTVREQTFNSSYKSATLYPVNRRNPLE